MSEFSIDPVALDAEVMRLSEASSELEALRADIAVLSPGGMAAFGSQQIAAQSFEGCCSSWTGVLTAVAASLEELGRSMTSLSEQLTETDDQVASIFDGPTGR